MPVYYSFWLICLLWTTHVKIKEVRTLIGVRYVGKNKNLRISYSWILNVKYMSYLGKRTMFPLKKQISKQRFNIKYNNNNNIYHKSLIRNTKAKSFIIVRLTISTHYMVTSHRTETTHHVVLLLDALPRIVSAVSKIYMKKWWIRQRSINGRNTIIFLPFSGDDKTDCL